MIIKQKEKRQNGKILQIMEVVIKNPVKGKQEKYKQWLKPQKLLTLHEMPLKVKGSSDTKSPDISKNSQHEKGLE